MTKPKNKVQAEEIQTEEIQTEEFQPEEIQTEEFQPEAQPEAKPKVKAQAVGRNTYEISVNCPTPLRKNPSRVSAFDEAEAWEKFCLQNGISGTDHPKTITLVDLV